MPRGSRPSTIAVTMMGERNARDSVVLTERSLDPSRAAIAAGPAMLPVVSSCSHALARPIAARMRSRSSLRAGRRCSAACPSGTTISRRRWPEVGDQGSWISSPPARSISNRARPDGDRAQLRLDQGRVVDAFGGGGGSQLLDDGCLDLVRCYAPDGPGLPILGYADIVAVAPCALPSVGRAHRVTAVIPDAAGQEMIRRDPLPTLAGVSSEAGLDRIPDRRIDDRKVLAGVDPAFVRDLARVDRVWTGSCRDARG